MSAGRGIVRDRTDRHYGHASPTPNPKHKTPYVSSLQDKVFVEGRKNRANWHSDDEVVLIEVITIEEELNK
jgi:hypothetical protein